MAGERQLIPKLSLAFGSETHLRAEVGFAGKTACRIVLFSFEFAQGDDHWLCEIIFRDDLFLMNSFLQRSGLR